MIYVLFGLVLILFAAGISFYCSSHRSVKLQIQLLAQENHKLKKDLRIYSASIVTIGQSITRLEEYTHRLSARLDLHEAKQAPNTSYAHAAKIVQIGGSVDDLVEGCGLTHAEAELVAALHKKNPRQQMIHS